MHKPGLSFIAQDIFIHFHCARHNKLGLPLSRRCGFQLPLTVPIEFSTESDFVCLLNCEQRRHDHNCPTCA